MQFPTSFFSFAARHRPPVLLHRLCTSGANKPHSDREAAFRFIVDRGFNQEVAKGVLDALTMPGSGLPSGQLLETVTRLAGRYEVGEDAVLNVLAKSVEQELNAASGKRIVRFRVIPPNGAAFDCEGFEGQSLKEVAEHGKGDGAKLLAELIECACSGVMACSTCQVYVDPIWYATLGTPSEAEQDMLELAHEPQENSRLGCQLRLEPKLEGMMLTIPSGSNNLFDNIPFE